MKFRIALFLLLSSQFAFAQTGPYVKLRFNLNNSQIIELSSKGFDPEGLHKISSSPNTYEAELSQEEMALVKSISKKTELIIPDVS